jgi:hypothetical protein
MFAQGSTRIRTTEFFGVVLPGFYLVMQLSLLVLAFPGISGLIDWSEVPKSLEKIWAPALVILLFVSYLIGSVFRATSVKDTDDFCYDLYHAHRSGDMRSYETERYFPYVESLRGIKNAIIEALSREDRSRLSIGDMPNGSNLRDGPSDAIPPFGLANVSSSGDKAPWDGGENRDWRKCLSIFDFWKARLCIENSSGFEFAQAAEARTRFFAGIIWAARWGLTLMFFVAAFLVFCGSPGIKKIVSFWKVELPFESWLGVCVIIFVWLALSGWGWKTQRNLKKTVREASKKDSTQSLDFDKLSRPWRYLEWSRVALEVFGTPALFWAATKDSVQWPPNRLFAAFALTSLSAFLFWFLGKRLRQVRASEVRGVYLNYCALVLFRPESRTNTAKSDPN